MRLPAIVLNFKTHPEVLGKKGWDLAKRFAAVADDVSVTTAKPEVISRALDRIHAVNPKVVVLCGAGVRTRKDVAKALELGTSGVLLATGVVKSKDPEGALRDLIKGLPSGAPRRPRSR